MTEPLAPGERAKAFFDGLWSTGDPWSLETAEYDQQKDDVQIDMLAGRRYRRALEVGCGAGTFTRKLTQLAETIVAVDVSAIAIDAAMKRGGSDRIRYCAHNIMEFDVAGEGPWDLVVVSETIYYLGWLYPFFDLAWLVHQMFEATHPGGRLLMVNTDGGDKHYLHQAFVLRAYRELLVSVGYEVEREQTFRGMKNGIDLEALLCLVVKPDTGKGDGSAAIPV